MTNSDREWVDGAGDKVVGEVKQGVGEVTGDHKLEVEGKLDEVKGDLKEGLADIKEKVGDLFDRKA